ncbi:MAG: DUF2064 domain-containing protein [Bacteroidetes bacterium]|nr:DUF2064 domain-containing protein [Bacteroidota bacterium]
MHLSTYEFKAMEKALIIFSPSTNEKNEQDSSVDGKHVTSLNRYSEIYTELIQHSSKEAARVKAHRYVFFKDDLPENDSNWPDSDFIYEIQTGRTFGESLSLAFESLFRIGYKEVVFLSINYPELTFELIDKAIFELKETDAVIGPSRSGGYYLLALKQYNSDLFMHKLWDTDTVFDATIQDFMQNNQIWFELPILNCIESDEDIHLANIKKFYRKIIEQTTLSH